MENRFSNVPVCSLLSVCWLYVYDKELFFSSGSYKSFLSDFPLWRGWGLSEEVFVIKTHWSLTIYFQIHLFDLGDR